MLRWFVSKLPAVYTLLDINQFIVRTPQSAGMQGCGSLSLAGVVGDYPWKELGKSHIVDVGGGQGALCVKSLRSPKSSR